MIYGNIYFEDFYMKQTIIIITTTTSFTVLKKY